MRKHQCLCADGRIKKRHEGKKKLQIKPSSSGQVVCPIFDPSRNDLVASNIAFSAEKRILTLLLDKRHHSHHKTSERSLSSLSVLLQFHTHAIFFCCCWHLPSVNMHMRVWCACDCMTLNHFDFGRNAIIGRTECVAEGQRKATMKKIVFGSL